MQTISLQFQLQIQMGASSPRCTPLKCVCIFQLTKIRVLSFRSLDAQPIVFA